MRSDVQWGLATATALHMLTPAAAKAETPAAPPATISISTDQGCLILPSEHCSANNKVASLLIPSGTGTLKLSYKTYDEAASFLPYQQSWRLGRLGSIGAEIDWNTGIKGQAIAAEKSFLLGDSRVAFGATFGRLNGQINLHDTILAHVNAGKISTPYGSAGWSAQDYVLHDQTWHYEGSTKFALLRQSLNYGLPISPRLQLAFSEHAGFGTRTYYGAGIELSYASHGGEALHKYSPSLCESENALNTTDRFAIGFGVCATKITDDRLYNEELKQAAKLGRRLEGYTAKVQPAVDVYNRLTGDEYQLQHHTAQSVLNFMGVENPYDKIHYSFNLRAQWRLNKDLALSADVRKPARHSARAGLGLHYAF